LPDHPAPSIKTRFDIAGLFRNLPKIKCQIVRIATDCEMNMKNGRRDVGKSGLRKGINK